jgi:hypothetical protein
MSAMSDGVAGSEIRFIADIGIDIPLMDDEGLLPSDPGWLHAHLGLSETLVAELKAWMAAFNDTIGSPHRAGVAVRADYVARGYQLQERVRAELLPGLTLVDSLNQF